VQQQSKNFMDLTAALQTGDLSTAQSAYATLQKQIEAASQTAGGKSLFDANSATGKAFQAIGTDLQSGNVSGAQSALADFKQAIKAAKRHHGHHAAAGSANSAAPTNSSVTTNDTGTSGLLNVSA
jgi:hypothetical protein